MSHLLPLALAILVGKPADAMLRKTDLHLSTAWAQTWDDCYDVNLPNFTNPKYRQKFMALMVAGDQWELDLERELGELQRVSTVSCRRWESGNGSERLREFLSELSRVATEAISLQGKMHTVILPQLNHWNAMGNAELKAYGFSFDQLICGKSFRKMETRIAARVAKLRAKVEEFGTTCVKSADPEVIAALESFQQKSGIQANGQGSPLAMAKRKFVKRESQITGKIENIYLASGQQETDKLERPKLAKAENPTPPKTGELPGNRKGERIIGEPLALISGGKPEDLSSRKPAAIYPLEASKPEPQPTPNNESSQAPTNTQRADGKLAIAEAENLSNHGGDEVPAQLPPASKESPSIAGAAVSQTAPLASQFGKAYEVRYFGELSDHDVALVLRESANEKLANLGLFQRVHEKYRKRESLLRVGRVSGFEGEK